jgi:hypothetical protein
MRRLLALALAIPAVAAAASAAPEGLKPVTLTTSGRVVALAADGDRAALIVSKGRDRLDVVVWEPARRRLIPIYAFGGGDPGGGLALAGTRVAWDEAYVGNEVETYIVSATLARRAPVELGGGLDSEEEVGDVVLRPVGDGRLLAFTDEVHSQTGDISAATVWRAARRGRCPGNGIDPFPAGHCARVAMANGELTVLAVDAGRIAARTDHGVRLLTSRGGRLRDFPVTKATAAALSGNRLALRVPNAVEVYDTGTGELMKRFGVARSVRLEDLEHGILVTASGRTLTLRSLRDGRTATLRKRGIAHGQLEPSGLFIAAGRRVTFTPMSDVLLRLRE